MKITVYLSTIPSDGGKFQYSISILDALKEFNRSQYEISVVYTNNYWKEYCSDKFKNVHYVKRSIISRILRKIILVLPYGLSIWRNMAKYIDNQYILMKKTKPDLVIYPGNNSLAYEYDFPSAIPVFDLMHIYEPRFSEVQGKTTKARNYHYSKVSEYAKVILVDSEVGKYQLIESFRTDADKIFVLPFIPPKYIYEEVDVSKELEQFDLLNEFIFYPAQFWAHKNHLNLLEAIALLKNRNVVVNAIFVGSKKNGYGNIIKKIEELNLSDQVKILDYVSNSELVALYKKATALVMPTFFGPTNIPPLEALALGCPVAVSNIYGMPDQVGDAALLFDPNDSEDIALKIETIVSDLDLREKLITKGLQRMEKFNIENHSHRLQEILSSGI